MNATHVDGKEASKVMLYTLSTCVWCKKTKARLKELGVPMIISMSTSSAVQKRTRSLKRLRSIIQIAPFPRWSSMIANVSSASKRTKSGRL